MAKKKLTINANDSATSKGDAPSNSSTPKLMLRTYRPTDFEAVRQLYIETLFALVPEGVRRKLWSVMTWVIWFVVYTLLLKTVPKHVVQPLFPSLDIENSNWIPVLKVVLTFGWAVAGFAAMFIVTERFEITEKVQQGLLNDSNDPEFATTKMATNDGDATDVDDHIPGHFWVLLANDEVCGMMGLAPASKQPLVDSRPQVLPIWKQVVQSIGRCFFISLFESSSTSSSNRPVITPSQPQHTATIVRWAVANEYQQCENGLTDVYATTNEVEMAAEQILEKRHGFHLVKKHKIGWFGRYECTWVCHVDDWIEQNKNHVNSKFKPSSSNST
ncbi:unnamed protein product [Absidia cylindrospora]